MKHVVIVGAGFGGLRVAKGLGNAAARVTVVDRSNHHLFQPLLYQVATAGLSPADIAMPVRAVLRRYPNIEVLMGEVTGVDPASKRVLLADREVSFDWLVLATGARHGYFGHEDWERFAPGLKTIGDATSIRHRILNAFERAEMEPDSRRRRALLTFVIVGAGPTGVEMAGSMAELAHVALAADFRHIDPRSARVLLLEAGPRILAAFPEDLAAKARRSLEGLGVEVRVGARVEGMDARGVSVSGERIGAGAMVWAAGVVASRAGQWLGAETDRSGRVKVAQDLSVPGHPTIFVIGDTAAAMQDGKPLPGLAPVAMQQGDYVAALIRRKLADPSASVAPFRYVDKGNLATVGRSSAVADLHGIHLSGFVAWVTWLFVHIVYLIGFRNRVLVLLEWFWAYVTFQRGARLIVGVVAGEQETTPAAWTSSAGKMANGANPTKNEDTA